MRWLAWMTATLLSGCMASPVQPPEGRFDFGPRSAAAVADTGVTRVDITAPSWLASNAMQYRLLYADAARRLAYAESRWAAPPTELLKQALEQQLAANGGGRCRLRVELTEFIQTFDSPVSSRFLLEARATLVQDQDILASRTFSETQAAPTADARGGVAAASLAGRELGNALAGWLSAHGERCRAG